MVTLVRDRTDQRALRAAAIFFGLAVLFHNGDHLRRGGDSVSAEVFVAGSLAILLEVGVVILVLARHRAAAAAAVAVGFSLALGYITVHFTPDRSFLSDSFVGTDAAVVSIIAASLEAASALLLGIAGALVLRRDGLDGPPAAWRDAFAHPLVGAMIAGNAFILIGSLATR
jgi:hypothetical protein